MKDFQPISPCNVIYRVISKILVNRVCGFMKEVSSEDQAAFIPGSLISDNVILAHELLYSMVQSRAKVNGSFALKVDMAKAFDRVERPF